MDLFFSIVTWVLIAISALAVLRALADRFIMRATYGGARYDEMQTVTSLLGFQTQRIFTRRAIKWIALWIGFAALAHHFQHSERPWAEMGQLWLPMIAFMVGCVQFFGQMRPAAILVLGASNQEALGLQRSIFDKLFPHLPVSLLETSDVDVDMRIMPGEVYRITLGDWQDAVWRFARSVLVIVVDMRQMTPPVERELQFIVDENLQYKSILLDPKSISLSKSALSKCRIVSSPHECVAIVARAFDGYDSLPSDVHPLRDLDVTKREPQPP